MSNFGDPRLPERIWDKITVADDGCWLWTGAVTSCGYARAAWQGRARPVHRLNYEVLVGSIPEGLEIDHLCRIRNCVNPAHMEPVTHRENILRAPRFQQRNQKTRCPHGHEFTEKNTYIDSHGYQTCRPCRYASHARWLAKQKKVSLA